MATKGILEVGHTEETHEVVINHPDLDPDENGVGHIIFSPEQARNLANLLLKHAHDAEAEKKAKQPKPARKSCNRHDDCDASEQEYVALNGRRPGWNFHCRNEECEECFGN